MKPRVDLAETRIRPFTDRGETFYNGVRDLPCLKVSSPSPPLSTRDSTSQRPKGRDGALSALDVPIQVLTLAKDTCGVPPAQVALGSAVVLLTMIKVRVPPRCDDIISDSRLSRTA